MLSVILCPDFKEIVAYSALFLTAAQTLAAIGFADV